ncbi:patatin-like phospholipase family protein [Lacibacterium aquatile]|uniref:Patatin-like phospholipase family protein n=1 Tax=Lacibacterium aquatile TaxID=1168082 RepID=A0ABW5DZK4_9PROT
MGGYARLLCIDGGGIRGVIPASALVALEERLGAPIASGFDLVVGTSTGGIIAAGLTRPGTPMTSAEMLEFYRKDGPRIFDRSFWKTVRTAGGAIDEKYDAAVLESVMEDCFGQTRLSESGPAELLITAYDIEARAPVFFKSWRARGRGIGGGGPPVESYDFLLKDICRATCAAPTYFEPALIENRAATPHALIDGSVVAANPTMCAIASAHRLFPGANGLLVLSIGTGQRQDPISYEKARHWGLMGWARPISDVILDAVSATVDYQAAEIVGDTYFRLQIPLHPDGEMAVEEEMRLDNAHPRNIARLEAAAARMLTERASVIERFCDLHRALPRFSMSWMDDGRFGPSGGIF